MSSKIQYIILPWDSDLFSFSVASVIIPIHSDTEFKELITELKQNNIALAYWFVEPNDQLSILIATSNKVLLVDKKITYKKLLNGIGEPLMNQHIFSYVDKPITDKLLSLSIQSGGYSRFKRDPHFPDKLFEKLYQQWVIKSVTKEIAKDVLVYKVDNSEAGMITIEIKKNTCTIGLLAVDERFRGKGIGTMLIQAACMRARELGYNELSVSTQKENKSACSFYEKMGFNKDKEIFIYHIWTEQR